MLGEAVQKQTPTTTTPRMEFTVEQIALMLNGEVKGDKSLKVSQLAKIEDGTEGSISFLANLKYEHFLYTTKASAVIVDKTFEPKKIIIQPSSSPTAHREAETAKAHRG